MAPAFTLFESNVYGASLGRGPVVQVAAHHHHPIIFGQLIGAAEETGTRVPLLFAYLIGAGFMIFAAIIQMILGVRAEQKSLESIAAPLTAIKEQTGAS